MPVSPRLRLQLPLAACLLATANGCDAISALEDGGALVNVFSTHHATEEDGVFPRRGDDEGPRVFFNDMGWEITLFESYVTTAAVTLISCTTEPWPLEMFWGPCPEDMHGEDLQTLTVAGLRVSDGDYCGLRVEYGPYVTPEISEDTTETRHVVPINEVIEGSTIYLRGAAVNGQGDRVEFELRSSDRAAVDLDLSTLEAGAPLNVGRRESFPKELLVSKTYDRYFDGIDFLDFDPQELENDLIGVLLDETRINPGQIVIPNEDI